MASDPASLIYSMLGNTGLGGASYQSGFQAAVQPQQMALQRQQVASQAQLVAAKLSEAQQQQQEATAFQADLNAWDGKPETLATLARRHPGQVEQLEKIHSLQDSAAKAADTSFWGQVQSAADNKAPALVKSRLEQRIAAAKAAGIDASDEQYILDQFGVSDDAGLGAASKVGLGKLRVIDPEGYAKLYGKGEDYTLSPGSTRFDAQGRVIASVPFAPHYETVGPNQTLIQTGGGDLASTAGGDVSRLVNSDAGGGYVPPSVQTLGQFVSYGKALNAKGAKSSSAGTYQINGTTMREFGPKALGSNWASAPFNADTQEKVGEAIFDWAKQQKNPAAALKGRWVSLTSDEAQHLAAGDWSQARGLIAQKESGGGPGASAVPAAGGARVVYTAPDTPEAEAQLDDATVSTMADQYLSGDPSVLTNLGRGKQGSANVVKLRAAIAKAAKARGMSGAQIAAVMQDYKTHQQTLNAFAKGPEARTVRSLNVTIDHLDTLQNAAQALQNGDIRIFNTVRQKIAAATGSAVPTNFEGVKQIVSSEVAKAIVGGQTALADRQDLAHAISKSNSPQQLAGYLAEVRKLLAGQLQGLESQYRSGTGRNDFAERLSPRTRHALGYGQPAQPGAQPIAIKRITRVK